MSSITVTTVQRSWHSLLEYIQRLTRAHPLLSTLAAGVPLTLALTWPALRASYKGYIALGPGGMPHNVFGWVAQGLLLPFALKDTQDTAVFSNPRVVKEYAPHGTRSFFDPLDGPLPVREGPRPTVPGYVAPQRQTSSSNPGNVGAMRAFLSSLADNDKLEICASKLEHPHTPALATSPPAWYPQGEIAHVHAEGSAHMVLSLVDAAAAVHNGWAERHRLAGRGLPHSYVLVYAPRDDAEMEVWCRLVRAAVGFVTAAGETDEI